MTHFFFLVLNIPRGLSGCRALLIFLQEWISYPYLGSPLYSLIDFSSLLIMIKRKLNGLLSKICRTVLE